MRATGDFKVFCFKVLLCAWSEPKRKREGKYSSSEVLINLSSRLREYEENRANLFGLFGVRYGVPTGYSHRRNCAPYASFKPQYLV